MLRIIVELRLLGKSTLVQNLTQHPQLSSPDSSQSDFIVVFSDPLTSRFHHLYHVSRLDGVVYHDPSRVAPCPFRFDQELRLRRLSQSGRKETGSKGSTRSSQGRSYQGKESLKSLNNAALVNIIFFHYQYMYSNPIFLSASCLSL